MGMSKITLIWSFVLLTECHMTNPGARHVSSKVVGADLRDWWGATGMATWKMQ